MKTAALSRRASTTRMDTGINAADRGKVAQSLGDILAGTYTLLLKTHVYHWNVVGPLFLPIHALTEAHYKNLFEAADAIAERIRALGSVTPLSFQQLLPKSEVEEERTNRTAVGMVEQLVADHEALTKEIREAAKASEASGDLVTTDLLTQRLGFHEKAIWMLRATISA